MRLAIVGATGLVGETLLSLLDESSVSFDALYLLASKDSSGRKLVCRDREYLVAAVDEFDFSTADFAIFSAGNDVALQYAPKAVAAGCTVIDNSSAFRYQETVPLVVPEVNGDLLSSLKLPCIIANPNCSTIQMVLALKPLDDVFHLKRVDVATYQSVSGAGREAMQALREETEAFLEGEEKVSGVFPARIAFNMVPEIDQMQDNGFTREEMKMVWETRKILNKPAIQVSPTAVRVPAFCGHAEALHLQFEKPITVASAIAHLQAAPGVELADADRPEAYPTQASHGEKTSVATVGRLRQDLDDPCRLNLWVVADNLRKGAALNALQILMELHRCCED